MRPNFRPVRYTAKNQWSRTKGRRSSDSPILRLYRPIFYEFNSDAIDLSLENKGFQSDNIASCWERMVFEEKIADF